MKFSYPSGSKPLEGYTIKRGIGIGGFGEVYFALSEAGKEVALKKIQRNLDVELRGVRQCLNLKHVNLISLWDIRTNEHGESWVVMEYVAGPSLRDVVEQHPAGMPEEELKNWFVSTASGVAYLHEHGIVHRDLKPGNIFLDADSKVIKIGDYGLSKFISCSRRSGQTESVGTFHYMAPEIGKGVYGKEIDIYAMGIILFEMLTGDVPFEGESTQEIIMKHLTADPNVDRVPVAFRPVIQKSLRKDPELRYNSVPEMLADLPWPEVAANSQNIISQHSVGPLVSGTAAKPTNPHPHQSQSLPEAKILASGSVLPPVLIDSSDIEIVKPDIVFGPLKDTSQAGTRNGSHANSGLAHSRSTDDPIRVIGQPASSRALTVPELPAPEKSPLASATAQEPIARALSSGFAGLGQWWNQTTVSTPLKVVMVAVASVVIIINSQWLLPLALGLGLVYLIYYAARTWLQTRQSISAESSPRPSKRELRLQQSQQIREWIYRRPAMDRATELLGSLLVGAFACLVLNLLGLAIGESLFNTTIESWAVYAWLTTTSVFGCWAVLLISKIWEPRKHRGLFSSENIFRRLAMVLVGLSVGAVTFFSAGVFSIDLANTGFCARGNHRISAGFDWLADFAGLSDFLWRIIWDHSVVVTGGSNAGHPSERRECHAMFDLGDRLQSCVGSSHASQLHPRVGNFGLGATGRPLDQSTATGRNL